MPSDTRLASTLDSLAFDSATRLHRLEGDGALGELLVEAWSLRESLDAPWTLELSALGLDARLDLQSMLGARATLQMALAGGSLQPRSGIVFAAAAEEADGGFARYRLTLRPWTALLAHTRQSRVWQEKTTIEIVESVFACYAARAQWRWADDAAAHLAQSPYAGSGERRATPCSTARAISPSSPAFSPKRASACASRKTPRRRAATGW